MRFIFLGMLAFVLMFLYDFYTLKNKRIKKSLSGIMGLLLFIFSAVTLIVYSPRIIFPVPVFMLVIIIALASGFLLIYSLFLELPFKQTYASEEHNDGLVDTGTYALCRHPGVLWFGLLFVSLFFLTGAVLLVPAAIIWTGTDVFYVYLQEKFIFNKIFSRYETYIESTPMLMPNRGSIIKCKNTLFRR